MRFRNRFKCEQLNVLAMSRWRWALAVVACVLFVGYALALVGSEFVGAFW